MLIFGKIIDWLGFPGLVRPFRHYDGATGQCVEIKISPFYTKLIVGEKEFFFSRESGNYDGFGNLSADVTSADCTEDVAEKSAPAPEPSEHTGR